MKTSLRGIAIRAAMKSDAFVRFASRHRVTGVDADLDPQIAAILELQGRMKLPPLESMEVTRARRFAEAQMAAVELPAEPMAQVIDTFAGFERVPVRIFVPHDASDHWLVWIHGGGGVIGSLDSSERHARFIAAQTKCTVASVGYRLGPEDRHPAGTDDCSAAFQAIAERVPRGGKLAVGGDSYGGYAAIMVEHHARETGGRRPDVQLLVYPAVDWTQSFPSLERNASGYLLTRSMMSWFRANLLEEDTLEARRAMSPWFWDDSELAGAAPAIIATAGYDPLVDEGDAWASRLRKADVAVRHHRYPGQIHGFLSLGGVVRSSRAAFAELCADVSTML